MEDVGYSSGRPWNTGHSDNKVASPSETLTPVNFQTGQPTGLPSCTFVNSLDQSGHPIQSTQPNTYWFIDALTLKANGGGSPYIQWNSKSLPPSWVYDRVSDNHVSGNRFHNFPYEFCSCSSPTTSATTCQHMTPSQYLQ